MKKFILSLVAASLAASASLAHAAGTTADIVAAAPPTNVVQPITLTLTYVSQINYTNAIQPGVEESYTNWDVLRTNRAARVTNVVDTFTKIYRSVTNRFVTKDVVAAINPDLAGGSLVLVTSSTDTNGNSQVEIRKGSTIYVVPNGTLYLQTSNKARTGADATVISTAHSGSNVTSTVTPSSKGYRVEYGNLVLNTPTLSFNISGKTVEGFGVTKVAGVYVPIHTTSGSFVGTGTDAAGFNEIVIGTVSAGAGKVEN